jgi:hypothetical protein
MLSKVADRRGTVVPIVPSNQKHVVIEDAWGLLWYCCLLEKVILAQILSSFVHHGRAVHLVVCQFLRVNFGCVVQLKLQILSWVLLHRILVLTFLLLLVEACVVRRFLKAWASSGGWPRVNSRTGFLRAQHGYFIARVEVVLDLLLLLIVLTPVDGVFAMLHVPRRFGRGLFFTPRLLLVRGCGPIELFFVFHIIRCV